MITYATISSVERQSSKCTGKPYLRVRFEEEPGSMMLFEAADVDLEHWRDRVGETIAIRVGKRLGSFGEIYSTITPFDGFRQRANANRN